MVKIYDSHTLYIRCDCASVDQIRNAFGLALTEYQEKKGVSIDCRYRVNLLVDREGNSFGAAFVFVTNSAVYHMLLGKNEDGSDRVDYMDDPTWNPPNEDSLANESGWTSAPVYDDNLSWADLCDIEDEYERFKDEEEQRYICPKIVIKLDPLMTLPPYKLTAQQIEDKRNKIIDENVGKSDFDPNLVVVSEFAYFGVDRAVVQPVDHKFMPNILKSQNIPEWITKDDLKAQFRPYATDSISIQERIIKGCIIEETYPFVNINEGRVAFVIFDPNTYDAQFALHMMKKLSLSKRLANGSSVSTTLYFGHSYCTDRDSMATIVQQQRSIKPYKLEAKDRDYVIESQKSSKNKKRNRNNSSKLNNPFALLNCNN